MSESVSRAPLSRAGAAAHALAITAHGAPARERLRAAVAKEPARYDYARQKLFEAVTSLVGRGSMGMRLGYANIFLVQLIEKAPTELDCVLEPIIEALRHDDPAAVRTKAVPLRSQGDRLARRIFEVYVDLIGPP